MRALLRVLWQNPRWPPCTRVLTFQTQSAPTVQLQPLGMPLTGCCDGRQRRGAGWLILIGSECSTQLAAHLGTDSHPAAICLD